MDDDLDLDLRQPGDRPSLSSTGGPASRAPWRLLVLALVVVAAALGGYFVYQRRQASASAGPAEAPAASTSPASPLGAPAAAVEVPPLDQSDAFVRELIAKLSSDPRLLAWLASDGLIRTFTVVVANVAAGETPARLLPMMRPLSGFRVTTRGDGVFVDPRGYERYTAIADAAASLDPAGSAQLYATLKPRIEEAYRDLGYPDASFDRTLERAIVVLLSTPVSDTPARLMATGGTDYAYADARLEGLSAAQKQLLRTGPQNARVIQDALRRIALALGIPESRLPPAR
jgi:hypothetical protein